MVFPRAFRHCSMHYMTRLALGHLHIRRARATNTTTHGDNEKLAVYGLLYEDLVVHLQPLPQHYISRLAIFSTQAWP